MKINIDNAEYELNKEKAVELGVLTPIVKHKVGNYYENCGDLYMLATIGERMRVLVNIQSGGYWTDPIKVANGNNITDAEWNEISTHDKDFKLVKVVIKKI